MSGIFSDPTNGVHGSVNIDDSTGYSGTSTDGLYTFDNQLSEFQLVNALNTNGLLFDVSDGTEVNVAYTADGSAGQLFETIPGGPNWLPSYGAGYPIEFNVSCGTPEPITLAFVGAGLLALAYKRRLA